MEPAGGAYVATIVVAMYALIARSSNCHRATIKTHSLQGVAWYSPTIPEGRIHANDYRRHICATPGYDRSV